MRKRVVDVFFEGNAYEIDKCMWRHQLKRFFGVFAFRFLKNHKEQRAEDDDPGFKDVIRRIPCFHNDHFMSLFKHNEIFRGFELIEAILTILFMSAEDEKVFEGASFAVEFQNFSLIKHDH